MSDAKVRTGTDTFVTSASPSQNFAGGHWLRVQGGATTQNSFVFLKPPMPVGSKVLSATLRIYGVGVFTGTPTINVQLVAAGWIVSQVDYANQPGVTGAVVPLAVTETVDAQEWAFDVSAILQTIANGGTIFRGFRISTADTTERKFYSLDAVDNRPVLEVDWVLPPDAPTELCPSGGSAVSIAKPVLTFNYHDVTGASAMQACRVQIKATNTGWTAAAGFAAPDFDSAAVTTSDPQLDLSTTAYAGITAGASTFWSVQVQNADNQWSQWSAPVTFTRIDKATVTINNPAVSPNNFVSDTTPQFSWTVTGGTQIARRIILADDSDPTNPLIDTHWQATAGTTYTPPSGIIKNESTVYRLTLRVKENVLRVRTPSDPIYVEVVRTFTFQESATPAAVTSLVAAQVANGQPHVKLTFNRTTAPDSFDIIRDGVNIDHAVDPASLFVSGTSYAYFDRRADPHTAHTWKVRSRVNGVVGAGPTVVFSYEVDEVWLCDVDTGKLVPIVANDNDKAQITYDMPETAALFRPVNGVSVVRMVQGQNGLEGHHAGRITDRAGATADTWVANMKWMKKAAKAAGKDFRLTVGDQNYRVAIGNVVIAPPGGGPRSHRAVSFDFWSLDGVV